MKGMNSMKRTERDLSLVISTKSNISESFNPLITTTFNLTDCSDDDRATSKAFKTASWPLRRVMSSNLKGSNVSRLN